MHFSPKLPTFNESQKVFSGTRFDVASVQIDGKKGNKIQREVVLHPGAVVILPLLDPEHLVMIRNRRFAVGKELWELPAGTLEPKEPPLETAKRELIEETGYQAAEMNPLTVFYTTPGFCNEVMYGYVASGLSYVGQALEETEQIIVEIVSWQSALSMVKEGTIVDAKTLTTLLFYNTFARSHDGI